MNETVATFPSWLVMWLLAGCFYFALKVLTLAKSRTSASAPEVTAWLLLCPTLDFSGFLRRHAASKPDVLRLGLAGIINIGFGALLVWIVAPQWKEMPMVAAWTGMVGLVFLLHFGCFHLVTAFWMNLGRDTAPLMKSPIMAGSLADFWGSRWNTAFRDAMNLLVVRPASARWNVGSARWLVFLISGLLHEAVISLPAGAGWGGPTAYFLLQAFGIELGRRLHLRRGLVSRAWAFAFILLPIGLLFHTPFIHRVILPFLKTIGALP